MTSSSSSDRARPRMSVEARRVDIVRRLLRRGLSPRLLTVLLPDWHGLVVRVATERPALQFVHPRPEPDDEDREETAV